MAPSKLIPVSARALDDAFEFVGSGPYDNRAYISRETGRIYFLSGYDDMEDADRPEDLEDPDGYLQIPDPKDLDLGRRLVLNFVSEHLPDDFDDVADMFHRRGAYARFKGLLYKRFAVQQWYAFEGSETKKARQAWCEEHGVQPVADDAQSIAAGSIRRDGAP